MADQFDLEQGIMGCWNVTSDLDVLFEELVENDVLSKDDASNFALGLKTIYEAKFQKLFRTFEEFIKDHYQQRMELEQTSRENYNLRRELDALIEERDLVEAANAELMLAADEADDLEILEDEFGFR